MAQRVMDGYREWAQTRHPYPSEDDSYWMGEWKKQGLDDYYIRHRMNGHTIRCINGLLSNLSRPKELRFLYERAIRSTRCAMCIDRTTDYVLGSPLVRVENQDGSVDIPTNGD